MEDGLWHWQELYPPLRVVLILVVMEDGLWPNWVPCLFLRSLNPCCNGRWSLTLTLREMKTRNVLILVVMEDGLWRAKETTSFTFADVLILVVMEDGLWHREWLWNKLLRSPRVLILVVMEDGLWQYGKRTCEAPWGRSLNPCCNGRWSLTTLMQLWLWLLLS